MIEQNNFKKEFESIKGLIPTKTRSENLLAIKRSFSINHFSFTVAMLCVAQLY